MSEVFGDSMNSGKKQSDKKMMSISEARPILEKAEEEKLTDSPTVSALPAKLTNYLRSLFRGCDSSLGSCK